MNNKVILLKNNKKLINSNLIKKIIFIDNQTFNWHYEIIESIIIKYNEIINIKFNDNQIKIFINCCKNNHFINYIENKYNYVTFDNYINPDYHIYSTIYDNNYDSLVKNSKKIFYISHEVTDRLKKLSNCIFLTPLSMKPYLKADILPFTNERIHSEFPIFIVQGILNNKRRNISLLIKILENKYNHVFKIKLIGNFDYLPKELTIYSDKIIIKNKLNFNDYHKEFLDGYCILPLILKKTHPQYYENKLTSTINYTEGYKLKCLIDKDLQNIYNLKNAYVFNDENDIVSVFTNALNHFYN